MVSAELASLIETLEKQAQMYRELLDLAKAKQPILVKGDLAKLEELTKTERELVLQVGRLEERRLKVHQGLASHFGVSAQELTLKKLVEMVEEPWRGKLAHVSGDFEGVLAELQSTNELNTQLIQQSLQYINHIVNLLTSYDIAPTYPGQDGPDNKPGGKLFDHKA